MREILVAYPSKDTALKLRSLLEGEGYDVPYVCATGASVLSIAQDMSEGVIVCAEGLRDMTASIFHRGLILLRLHVGIRTAL